MMLLLFSCFHSEVTFKQSVEVCTGGVNMQIASDTAHDLDDLLVGSSQDESVFILFQISDHGLETLGKLGNKNKSSVDSNS